MVSPIRTVTLAAALLVPLSIVRAEAEGGVAGHWEGAIHAPSGDVQVAVDLAFDGGTLVGAFSNASEQITGYPVWRAAADGRSVTVELKTGGPGVQTFSGTLSPDGASLSGDFLISVYAVPFSLTRTGDARITAPPRSPAIDESLAGTWSGSLQIDGQPLPVELTMRNESDGMAIATWASEGAVATPLKISQQGASVALASTVTRAAYAGALSADGTQIRGTFKEGAIEQPLTFTRAVAAQ